MTWYVAITNPNCHRRAEAELAALGYRAFWPKLRKWVRHARSQVAKEYPILGRYMFVEVPDGNFWNIRNVNGIEALVTSPCACGQAQPAAISPEIVYAFRERYMAGEWDYVINETGEFADPETGELITRRNRIPHNAIIRIMEGEFANMIAQVRGREFGQLVVLPRGAGRYVSMWPENVRAA